MSDISIRTVKTLGNEDQRWIGDGGIPLAPPRSILLDRSGFDLTTDFPNGFIPSGVVLGKVAATGLYIPYAGADSEIQTLVIDATGGTYDITFDGDNTGNITYAGTAGDSATMQAALEALPHVSPGDITVTQAATVGTATTFTLTFGGRYLGQNVPQISVTESLTGGAGTATPATGTAGGGNASNGSEIARGHLFASVAYDRASTGDIAAALFHRGAVDEQFLPTNHGLDAAAKVQLGSPEVSGASIAYL